MLILPLNKAIFAPKTLDPPPQHWYGHSHSKGHNRFRTNGTVPSQSAPVGIPGSSGSRRVRRVSEVSIPSPLSHFATRLALIAFRVMRSIKRGVQRIFRALGRGLSPLGRLFVRFFVLPIYRIGIMIRLRVRRLALPARGFVIFFVTNRYLFHAALGIIAIATILTNFQGRQANAKDIGTQSLLFALATGQQTEIVEEQVRPETATKNTAYLGSATVIAIPHVDFDYSDITTDVAPSIVVPGTIAAQPIEETAQGAPATPRTKTETYTVQENDTIGGIAQKFGVNVGTILWNNNLSEREYIRPGDTLKIPPVSGLLVTVQKGDTLQKIASRTSADLNEITSFNHLSTDATLAVGQEVMVPGGTPPAIVQTQAVAVARASSPPPLSVTAPISVPKPPDTGTVPASGKLLWPTSGHVITQYYSWKHTGVDIDGDYSSPIYAAADGVVEIAGWNNGGYGLMILIDNPNGMKTRYAHSSKMFVKAGDHVKRGQVIAMVGTTGHSTGTHLHFEVYVNGKRVNPLSYIR